LLDNFTNQSVGDSHMLVQFEDFDIVESDLVPSIFALDDGIIGKRIIRVPSPGSLFLFCVGLFILFSKRRKDLA
jgi:hypothetical protein